MSQINNKKRKSDAEKLSEALDKRDKGISHEGEKRKKKERKKKKRNN